MLKIHVTTEATEVAVEVNFQPTTFLGFSKAFNIGERDNFYRDK